MPQVTAEHVLLIVGALTAISSTVVGVAVQERIDRRRAAVEAEIDELRRLRDLRNVDVSRSASERHTAYLLLAIAQIPGPRSQTGPFSLINSLEVAGTRMAQALLWLTGAVFGSNGDPEVVLTYLSAEGLVPHVNRAKAGEIGSIEKLHVAYEKVFELWAKEYNELTGRLKALSATSRRLETKLMRVKYVTAAFQVGGVLIALFNDVF